MKKSPNTPHKNPNDDVYMAPVEPIDLTPWERPQLSPEERLALLSRHASAGHLPLMTTELIQLEPIQQAVEAPQLARDAVVVYLADYRQQSR